MLWPFTTMKPCLIWLTSTGQVLWLVRSMSRSHTSAWQVSGSECSAHDYPTATQPLPLPPKPSPLTLSSCNRATVGLPSSQQSSLSSGMKGHQMILRKWFSGVPSGCRMWTKISSLSRVLRASRRDDAVGLGDQAPPTFLQSPIPPWERILNFAINQG